MKTWQENFTEAELHGWRYEKKVCPTCKRLLSVVDCFGLVRKKYKNRTRICARAYCSRCDAKHRHERFRRNNPVKWQAYLKRFRLNEDLHDPVKKRARIKAWQLKNKERMHTYYKRYRLKFKDRHMARMIALAAYPDAQQCEKCELMGTRHHDDYTKPLQIRWLCRKHHMEADHERRAAERNQSKQDS